jgi:hypothetical protein
MVLGGGGGGVVFGGSAFIMAFRDTDLGRRIKVEGRSGKSSLYFGRKKKWFFSAQVV